MSKLEKEDNVKMTNCWESQDGTQAHGSKFFNIIQNQANCSPKRKLQRQILCKDIHSGPTTHYMNQSSLKTDKEYLLQYLTQYHQAYLSQMSSLNFTVLHHPVQQYVNPGKLEHFGKIDLNIHKQKTIISHMNESQPFKVRTQQSQKVNYFTDLKTVKKRKRIFVKNKSNQGLLIKASPTTLGKTIYCNNIQPLNQNRQQRHQNQNQKNQNVKIYVKHERWMTLNAVKKPMKFPLFYRIAQQQKRQLLSFQLRKDKSEFNSCPKSKTNSLQFIDDKLFKTKLIRSDN